MSWAEKIKAIRNTSGLSQKDFAERGVCSLAYVRALEAGKRSPTLVALELLLKGVGVSIQEFFESHIPDKYPDPEHAKAHEKLQVILESDHTASAKDCLEAMYRMVVEERQRAAPKPRAAQRRLA